MLYSLTSVQKFYLCEFFCVVMEVSRFFERKVGTRLRRANETLKDQNVSNFLDTVIFLRRANETLKDQNVSNFLDTVIFFVS